MSEATAPNRPFQNLRTMIESGPQNLRFEDDDNEYGLVQYLKKSFLLNLIENTPPTSKMAYKICHLLESNSMGMPQLASAFPVRTAAEKRKQVKVQEAVSDIDAQIATYREEIDNLKKRTSNAGLDPEDDMGEFIEGIQDQIQTLEEEKEEKKKNLGFKPVYPADKDKEDGKEEGKVRDKDWHALKSWLSKELETVPDNCNVDLFKNLEMLCDYLGMDKDEKTLTLLTLLGYEDYTFSSFIDTLANNKAKTTFDVMGRMINASRDKVSTMLEPTASLSMKGILLPASMDDSHMADESNIPEINESLIRQLEQPDLTIEKITTHMVGEPADTELDWDKDFSYLGERAEELVDLLKGTVESGRKGMNILLYGLPDTGKTEAVKALAKKVGLKLYMVGERDAYGDEPSREQRMRSALLAQALLADKKDAAILFDEMEDLLPTASTGLFADPDSGKPTGASKVFLNRLLENNVTPTLWTANDPEKFHAAVRRRFRYSVQFDVPPVSVRKELWTSIAARHDFDIPEADALELAKKYKAPPGMINTAVRNAVATGNGSSLIRSLSASATLLFGNKKAIIAEDRVPELFNVSLLNARIEKTSFGIQDLARRMRESSARDVSLILYGAPGTGKSAFAAYLARELGMEPLFKKASDLLDKYVGESEKKIAQAFQEAEEGNRFLIFDEGDTFVRNRESLRESWQVSQVNEMLAQIEAHKLPIALTTNLFEDIDPAAKRRFTFKILYENLTADQAAVAYETYFGRPAPTAVKQDKVFAPADFNQVKSQMRFMDPNIGDDEIMKLLQMEAKDRSPKKESGYSGSGKVGFIHTAQP